MPDLGGLVDDEGLDSGRKNSRAGLPMRSGLRAPQRMAGRNSRKMTVGCRHLFAAQQGAFDLHHKQSPRLRLQIPKVATQTINREPIDGHPFPPPGTRPFR